MDAALTGDCREVMRGLIADGVKVQMCVTSPPYWGLRDYGTASWEGGSEECGHRESDRRNSRPKGAFHGGNDESQTHPYRTTCRQCGARRIDAQLGLEATPEEYVVTMVEVFRLVRELLAEDGTLWVNMGDSYASGGSGGYSDKSTLAGFTNPMTKGRVMNAAPLQRSAPPGLKPKDLVGIPWRVTFALQEDGWYLRSDIIWHKPNPMPESVSDRPTKAHEYLFLLSKKANYFYDAEAVREPGVEPDRQRGDAIGYTQRRLAGRPVDRVAKTPPYRNRRSVWTIPTQPYSEAHFATFPRKLVEPCILAGTSERGHCPGCGARWRRIIERGELVPTSPHYDKRAYGLERVVADRNIQAINRGRDGHRSNMAFENKTLGWQPGCACGLDPLPDIVLDPFLGSGTSAEVAQRLGRRWLGIDLNPGYSAMQQARTAQRGLAL
ncbi:MAG: DNA-methyltransferase [Gammaproteobacteria bacterium]